LGIVTIGGVADETDDRNGIDCSVGPADSNGSIASDGPDRPDIINGEKTGSGDRGDWTVESGLIGRKGTPRTLRLLFFVSISLLLFN